MSVTTEVLTDIGALEGREREWNDLWLQVPSATPFQHPAWLLEWWRCFHPGRLFCISVRLDGRLSGIAPFYLEGVTGPGRLLPVGISLSDHLDALVHPEAAGKVLDGLSAALDDAGRWRDLCIPDLSPRSLLPTLALRSGKMSLHQGTPCPTLPISGDDGLGNVPAIKRRKLRMACHRLEQAGANRICDNAEMDGGELWSHLHRLHGLRWQGRGEPGVLAESETCAFQESALKAMADQGLARWYALDIAGHIVGVYYGFQHRKKAYAYLGGFDPEYAYFSPGTVLMGHALAQARNSGVEDMDFLRGGERYKYEWGATDLYNNVLTIERECRAEMSRGGNCSRGLNWISPSGTADSGTTSTRCR